MVVAALRGSLGRLFERYAVFIVFGLALTLLLQRMYLVQEWGDEGYFANAALRILDGQVLYRDFQHNYPPGRMYSLALLIEVFGLHS